MNYKYAVVIGRFQPFHNGHLKMLRKALETGEKVIIILGSARCARNIKNPFTAEEREMMIRSCLNHEENARLTVVAVRDYYYSENMWIADIQGKVRTVIGDERSVCLVGHQKDNSSYYLNLFPRWKFESVPSFGNLNATDVREDYFVIHEDRQSWAKDLPPTVAEFMHLFKLETETYWDLRKEYDFISCYKRLWKDAPYPVIFSTTDVVVVKSGHVLVVRRNSYPGKGLMALPGGFLDHQESILDGAFRELKEETGIRVPLKELKASIKTSAVFDHPGRSLRGRTISYTYFVDLGSGELPSVKGGDDAEKAFWIPLYDVLTRENEFFEDHAHIITSFIHK